MFDAVIIGAGISGLSAAASLKRKGLKVKVLEKASRPGGTMQTLKEKGYLVDFGPNTVVLNNPAIMDMVTLAGLQNRVCLANPCAGKRYVLKSGKMLPLPMGPLSMLKSRVFSTRAKLRLLKEPFIGRGPENESIGDFAIRRLGREFFEYAVDPFISGVYAGHPFNLSAKWAVPKIYRLEEKYGSLIRGAITGARERKKRRQITGETDKTKARICSFLGGIAEFPLGLSTYLGAALELNSSISSLKREGETFLINTTSDTNEKKSLRTRALVLSVPSDALDGLLTMLNPTCQGHFQEIPYAPVAQVFLGYDRRQVGHSMDGFGVLFPQKEKQPILGALMNSAMFPGRAPKGKCALTCFSGGMQNPGMADLGDEALVENCRRALTPVLNLSGDPDFIKVKKYPRAIPQYQLDYEKFLNRMKDCEQRIPGLFISGNFRGGISVGDCIAQSARTADTVARYLTSANPDSLSG
jgi:oxygen-dependent protoporphyrinogen oxidase